MSNSSVVKLGKNTYVDERFVRSVQRQTNSQDKEFTIINVDGVEHWVDLKLDEILRLIHWDKFYEHSAAIA